VIERAVIAGARVLIPMKNQFWGDRTGRIVDPSGTYGRSPLASKRLRPPRGTRVQFRAGDSVTRVDRTISSPLYSWKASMRMLPVLLTMSLAVGSAQTLGAQGGGAGAEEAQVRAVVERYLHGLKFNDTTSFQAVFWPQALLLFVKPDGGLGQLTQTAWYRMFVGSAGKEEEGNLRIVAVDVTQDAAAVKVVETYPKSVYTDYLNLLRIAGKWRVVNKIYTSRRQ
jgi:Putative lumazine-binding